MNSEHKFHAIYRTRFITAAIFCSAFTLILLWSNYKMEMQTNQQHFEEQTSSAFIQLQSQLTANLAIVDALSGWHHSQFHPNPSDLSTFSKELLSNYPHIYAIQYMQKVNMDERRKFEQEKRESGYATFSIKEKQGKGFRHSSEKAYYLPITYLEPLEPETAFMLGIDGLSDPLISLAISDAIESGHSTVSKPSDAYADTRTFFIFKAVYKGKMTPDNDLERRQQLDGVFAIAIQTTKLLSDALHQLNDKNTSLLLHHNDFEKRDALGHIIKYAVNEEGSYLDWLLPTFSSSHQLAGTDEAFTIHFEKMTKLADIKLSSSFAIICLSALILYLINLSLRRDLRHVIISEKTKDTIFKEKELAELTLHAIADGVITTDIHNNIEHMNPVAERLTGRTLSEAKQQPLPSTLVTVIEDTNIIEKDLFNPRYLDDSGEAHANFVLRHSNNKEYVVRISAARIRDRNKAIMGSIIIFRDITTEQKMSQLLSYQARHDELTGLFNRREFEHQLNHSLERNSTGTHQDVLCYIDLDQFKLINDTCGHVAGDELLKQVTYIINTNLRDRDIVARLGGDEFGIIFSECNLDSAHDMAKQIHQKISDHRFNWQGKVFDTMSSMGMVEINAAFGSILEIMMLVDSACYMAKDKGRNRIFIHRPDDAEIHLRQGEMQWTHKIRDAFEHNRFCLYRQKLLCLKDDNSPVHYEILIRMLDENNQIISPMAFLPAAERYSIMPEIDRWVIHNAFNTIANTNTENEIHNINLSGKSFNETGFLEFIINEFRVSGISPTCICFEITETAAISSLAAASDFISALREQGCAFALDDFGSGLSSFSYLKELPVDYLKIDGSFVRDMLNDPVDQAMVRSIVQVGQVMKIKTIAEFVESDEICQQLRLIDVDYAQGYAVEHPKPWLKP
jgi:diguanylate cyclase (GGDEF)-like protein/PAS domain S-box-containing protein